MFSTKKMKKLPATAQKRETVFEIAYSQLNVFREKKNITFNHICSTPRTISRL